MKYTMIVHMKSNGAMLKIDGCEGDNYDAAGKQVVSEEFFWMSAPGRANLISRDDVSYIEFIEEKSPTAES